MNNPDRWLIIKTPECYKVFATWAGGYLDGDSWKLNSGIAKMEEDGDHFLFIGASGSTYRCHKKCYGTTAYGASILQGFEETYTGVITVLKNIEECELFLDFL